MVEVSQSYEMVRNVNNFCSSWSKNFEFAYVVPEKVFLTMLMLVRKNFFDLTPAPANIFRKNFYDLVKIIGNVGQNMTTPPPPPQC
jgi:hypothetical protein